MFRGFLRAIVIVALSAGLGAQSWPPGLIASFPAPPGAIDVGFEWGPLYALVGGATPTVYTLNYRNGSITGSFNIPVPNGARGITTTGDEPPYLWISNRLNGFLYRLTTLGSLVSSFRCPGGTPYGLGGHRYGYRPDDGYLTVSCRDENHILRVNHTIGSVVSSFAGPATAVISYDEWLAVDRYANYLYWNYYGKWEVLATLSARPWGVATTVAWPTDQWVRSYVLCRNGYIYCYEGYTAVAPASLGRVKALFK